MKEDRRKQQFQHKDNIILETSNYSSIKYIKKYSVVLILVIIIVLLSASWGFSYRTKSLLDEQILIQSKTIAHEILNIRKWVKKHNGVFVDKEKIDTNLSLYKSFEIKAENNRTYILKNSSHITKELSIISQKN